MFAAFHSSRVFKPLPSPYVQGEDTEHGDVQLSMFLATRDAGRWKLKTAPPKRVESGGLDLELKCQVTDSGVHVCSAP